MICRKIDTNQIARKKEAIGYYRIESAIALFCALLINIFVVSVFARGFYGKVSGTARLLLVKWFSIHCTISPVARVLWRCSAP